MTLSDLSRLLAPLRNRVANMISRAVVRLADDSGDLQTLQLDVLDGETRDGIERLQQYGFTSVPLDGAEAAVLFVGGRRDHGLAVAVDDRRHRLSGLAPGEVALYHKDGAKVLLKADGSIEVTPKAGQDVKLAGGSAKVARVGDAVNGGTLTGAVPSGGGAVTFVYTPAGGGPPVSSTTAALTGGQVTAGADHVKA